MKASDLPIDHPWVSLSAAIDELLLIEHHARTRWCAKCARKHARTAAALADEAVSLSGYAEPYVSLAPRFRALADLTDEGADQGSIGAATRALRRELLGVGKPLCMELG